MDFEPVSYKIEATLIKTKLIVYCYQRIEIDYNGLKSNSTFFRENDHLFSSSPEIHLLSEENMVNFQKLPLLILFIPVKIKIL